MPIFISYNHKDKGFVDTLATNLVRAGHSVWMDRWEVNVGDSLIDKVQTALLESSAVIAVISKNSVDSAWCKKELNSSLVRELDEKNSFLLPIVIDDAKVPLFLREKLYADFRTKPDEAFELLDRSLARISNSTQGRIEDPEFHTDWSVDWGVADDHSFIDWTFVEHADNWPYVILLTCRFLLLKNLHAKIKKAKDAKKRDKIFVELLNNTADSLRLNDRVVIDDNKIVTEDALVRTDGGDLVAVSLSVRRLGSDNGMSTLVHRANILRQTAKQIAEIQAGGPA